MLAAALGAHAERRGFALAQVLAPPRSLMQAACFVLAHVLAPPRVLVQAAFFALARVLAPPRALVQAACFALAHVLAPPRALVKAGGEPWPSGGLALTIRVGQAASAAVPAQRAHAAPTAAPTQGSHAMRGTDTATLLVDSTAASRGPAAQAENAAGPRKPEQATTARAQIAALDCKRP